MNDKRYLKVKMLNLQQEVQALLAKGENLGPGIFDTIATDIDRLTTQIMDLRKKSKPTTAADTQAPETEVAESVTLSLENLYNEIKAVPGNTGISQEENNSWPIYYVVDAKGKIDKVGKMSPEKAAEFENSLSDEQVLLTDEDFRELRNIE
jgi:hypothetical protein